MQTLEIIAMQTSKMQIARVSAAAVRLSKIRGEDNGLSRGQNGLRNDRNTAMEYGNFPVLSPNRAASADPTGSSASTATISVYSGLLSCKNDFSLAERTLLLP